MIKYDINLMIGDIEFKNLIDVTDLNYTLSLN